MKSNGKKLKTVQHEPDKKKSEAILGAQEGRITIL